MKITKIFANAILTQAFLLPFLVYSQIILKQKSWYNNQWESNSVYIGTGLVAKDTDLIITWKKVHGTLFLGILYFMVPGHQDLAKFLFHNLIDQYPNESKTINLGKFQAGTPIIFMFRMIDTSAETVSITNKHLYTGQNRKGIDQYVSDLSTPVYGNRWAAAGRINNNRVEVGISDGMYAGWEQLMFYVDGVDLEIIDRYKTSMPKAVPKGSAFSSTIDVSLTVPYAGNYIIIPKPATTDSIIDRRPDSSVFSIFYTTDGSDPRTSTTAAKYNGSIKLSATTTLKAYAALQSDTIWYPSEVVTEVYTHNQTSIGKAVRFPGSSSTVSGYKLFSVNGRCVRTVVSSTSSISGVANGLSPGVYFLLSRDTFISRNLVVGR